MRILSLDELTPLNILPSIYPDQRGAEMFIYLAHPFSIPEKIIQTLADVFDGNPVYLGDINPQTSHSRNRLTLERCSTAGGFKSVGVINIPTRAVVQPESISDIEIKKGAIYLQAEILERHLSMYSSMLKPCSGWDSFPRTLELPLNYISEKANMWLNLKFEFEDWEALSKEERQNRINATTNDAKRKIPLSVLLFEICYLLNAKLIKIVDETKKTKIILEVFPTFRDGLTFECMNAVKLDFKGIRDNLVDEMLSCLGHSKDDLKAENSETLTNRGAQVKTLNDFTKFLGTTARGETSNRSFTMEEIYAFLTYRPYQAKLSTEVDRWMKSPLADDITYLLLAYSIGGPQWIKTLGILGIS